MWKRLAPTLTFAAFALSVDGMFLSLLTGSIAQTFFGTVTQATRGYTLQLSTVGFAATVLSALAMSILLIRFRYRSLYMVGAALLIVSIAGIFLAPNFFWMVVFFASEGIAGSMIFITGGTLIGDFLPQDRKAKTISYVYSLTWIAMIVGDLSVLFLAQGNFFASPGSWRYAYLLIALPVAIAVLPLAFYGISSNLQKTQSALQRNVYLERFKQIMANKSAVACLVGSLLFSGAIGALAINFFQQQFELSVQSSGLVALVSLSLFAAGSFVAGLLANKVGVKNWRY